MAPLFRSPFGGRCFTLAAVRSLRRMLCGRPTGSGDGQAAVVLRHRPTGGYLAPGARLAAEVADALVFPSAAMADVLTSQFACEPGSFVIEPTPGKLTSAA
jgi:hypothetical protein